MALKYDEKLIFCRICESVCLHEKSECFLNSQTFQCLKCRNMMCPHCSENPHPEKSCEEAKSERMGAEEEKKF